MSTVANMLSEMKTHFKKMQKQERKSEQGKLFTQQYKHIIKLISRLNKRLNIVEKKIFNTRTDTNQRRKRSSVKKHQQRLQHFEIIVQMGELLNRLHEKFSLVYNKM